MHEQTELTRFFISKNCRSAEKENRTAWYNFFGTFVSCGLPAAWGTFDTIGLNGVLKQMNDIENRSATFRCVLGLVLEDGSKHNFVGECKGNLIDEQRGTGGFGYDPIFIPHGFEKTFSELSFNEKNKTSHRGQAMKKLIDFISEM